MKKILLATTVLASAAVLSACKGKNFGYEPLEIPTMEAFKAQKEISVEFWHTMGADNQAILNEFITSFNVKYPNVKITHAAQGGYADLRAKMLVAIPAGNSPQLVVNYPDHVADYLQASVVIPLDEFMNNSQAEIKMDDLADFVPAYLAEGKAFGDDKYYSLPFNKSTEVMFYNKKAMADANITDIPTTWAGIEALKSKNLPCAKESLVGYDSAGNQFITWSAQKNAPYTKYENGKGSFEFVNDTTKAMLETALSLSENKIVKNPATFEQNNGRYSSDAFVRERVCFSIGSSAGARNQVLKDLTNNIPTDFEVGIAPMPQFDENNKAVIQQGPNVSMLASSNNFQRLATWLFMKHMTDTENTALYATKTAGYMPVRTSAYETKTYKDFLAKDATAVDKAFAQVALVAKDQSSFYFTSPVFPGTAAARNQVEAALLDILQKKANVNDALNNALRELTW